MKHAYLIMAHNDFYILEKLLKLLDSEHNDIYLHIDLKVKEFDFDYYKKILKKANLYFVKRTDIRWATFSQINCEYLLLEEATKKHYDYYHLLSGVDMPLKNEKEIYKFFQKNNGKEFVHFGNFDNIDDSFIRRVKLYHLFVSRLRMGKVNNFIFSKIWWLLNKLEEKLHVNRIKNIDIQFRNGANWFSITDNLAHYVINKKDFVYKHFKLTSCADEIFLQTIVYNSDFINKLYNYNNNDYKQIQRYIDWNRGEPYTFTKNEFDELINSGMLFARKFSTKKDKEIVDKIYNHLKGS